MKEIMKSNTQYHIFKDKEYEQNNEGDMLCPMPLGIGCENNNPGQSD